MIMSKLTTRVTIHGALAIVGTALLAGWLAGGAASAGVVAGGALALLDFRWLTRSASAAAAALTGGRARVGWMLAAPARLLSMFGAISLIIVSGRVAPLAVMAGLAVLPLVVIAQGLRAAREAD
jgi:hypothetical protein